MKLKVLDLETTMRAPGNSPDPFYPDNDVLMTGYMNGKLDEKTNEITWNDTCVKIHDIIPERGSVSFQEGYDGLLIGHNIGFDLNYILNMLTPECRVAYLKDITLFDTQTAHYLLSAQTGAMKSLKHVVDTYLPRSPLMKGDIIEKAIEAGLTTEDIKPSDLAEYLKNDLLITQQVFEEQLKLLRKHGMLNLFFQEMEAKKATLLMQHNGLNIDRVVLGDYEAELSARKWALSRLVKDSMRVCLPHMHIDDINPRSNQQLSLCLFGGQYNYTEYVPMRNSQGHAMFYKSGKKTGQPRVKKTISSAKAISMGYDAEPEWYLHNSDTFSTSEEVLKALTPTNINAHFIEQIMDLREIEKELNTYVDKYTKLIDDSTDGLIHASYHHDRTATGRLSSSKPNVQNISTKQHGDSNFLQCITARTPEGACLKVDFSQLEVAVLAHLSGDETLINELKSGEDIHLNNAKNFYGRDNITPEERRQIKEMTFQFQYGAGSVSLAKRWGMDKREAQDFIDAYYDKYEGVRLYHSTLKSTIENSAALRSTYNQLELLALAEVGNKVQNGVHRTPNIVLLGSRTGRIYCIQDKVDSSGSRNYWPPTEYKNYPVQGFATGDIMKVVLGALYQEFWKQDKALLVNTVHDDIWMEVLDVDDLEEVVTRIKKVLDNIKNMLYNIYKIELKVDLNYKIEVGKSFGQMEEYKDDDTD
jgi:DNA polymerase I-like protein with 3'-5' exonuclease and polymerase domains